MSFSDAFATSPTATKKKAKSAFASAFSSAAPAEIAPQQKRQEIAASDSEAAQESASANSFGGFLKNAFSAAAAPFKEGYDAAAATVQPKSFNPITVASQGAKAVEDSFMGSLRDAGDKIAAATATFKDHPITSTGTIGLAALSPIFAAATAPLTYATVIPGVGQVADKVNEIFSALGSGAGAHVATAYVDDNPFLSQKTKDTIRPLVHDSAALVAQIVAGKLGGAGVSLLGDKTKSILHTVGDDVKENPPSANPEFKAAPGAGSLEDRLAATGERKLPVFGDTSLREIPVSDQGTGARQVPFSNRYTPEAELPVIEAGRTPRSALPTIQIEAPKTSTGDLKYVPEPFSKAFGPRAPETPVAGATERTAPQARPIATPQAVETPVPRETSTFQPDTGAERGTSRLAANIEANAIEKKLTTQFGDLPEYGKVNWKDQAQRAAQFLSEDPAAAHRVALGQEPAPQGLLPNAVLIALEDRAIKNGDVLTLRRLARESTLSKRASEAGQEIGILSQRDQNSPVRIIENVQKAREAAFEEKTGTKPAAVQKAEVAKIKSEIKAAASKRPNWEEFMQELTCNT